MNEFSGLYQRSGVWWVNFRKGGKRHFVSLQTKDPQVALEKAIKVRGSDYFETAEKLGDCAEAFLSAKKGRGDFSRKTSEWAATPLKKMKAFFGDVTVSSVTAAKVEEFFLSMRSDGLADTSVASYMRAVRSFFSWMTAGGKILANPMKGMKIPKPAKVARDLFCSAALRDRLIAEAPDEDLCFILFAGFHAGLRRKEISEARPEWFDLELKVLHVQQTATFVPKNRDRRTVPMTLAFREFMRGYGLREPFVLRPEVKHGRSHYRYDFRLPFELYMAKQGVDWVTPHVMRHTFASLYAIAGVPLFKIAKWTGDTIGVVEAHYAHLHPDDPDIEKGHVSL